MHLASADTSLLALLGDAERTRFDVNGRFELRVDQHHAHPSLSAAGSSSAAVHSLALAGPAHRAADQRNPPLRVAVTSTMRTPTLLTRCGIGSHTPLPVLIATGDNPGRLPSEAFFAALCGASPLLHASSGEATRHRL